MIQTCLFLFLSQVFISDHCSLLEEGKEARVIRYGEARASETIDGDVVSQYAGGLVVRREDALWDLPWVGDAKKLKVPDGTLLSGNLPLLSHPFLVTRDFLYVYKGDKRHQIPLTSWVEFVEPTPGLGSTYGMRVLMPDVVGFGVDSRYLWLYQAKTGNLLIWDFQESKGKNLNLSEKMVLTRLDDRPLWLGYHDDRAALCGAGDTTKVSDQKDLPHWDRHSPVFPVKGGVWILTFSSGLFDILDAWETGRVDVHAVFISEQGERLNKRVFELDALPVSFEIGASQSGSPRLEAEPAFHTLPEQGGSRLFIVHGDQMTVLSAEAGPRKRQVKARDDWEAAIATKSGTRIWFADGSSFIEE